MKYPRFRRTIPGETIRPTIVLELSKEEHITACTVTDEEEGDEITEALNLTLDLKERTESLLEGLKATNPDFDTAAVSKVEETLNLIDLSLKRMKE